jgi:hypothetical protein
MENGRQRRNEMQIKIETIPTADGPMYDLVMVQGANHIRLGLFKDDAEGAAAQLRLWLEENTMDVAEIVRA